jgi:hypothetical protein
MVNHGDRPQREPFNPLLVPVPSLQRLGRGHGTSSLEEPKYDCAYGINRFSREYKVRRHCSLLIVFVPGKGRE